MPARRCNGVLVGELAAYIRVALRAWSVGWSSGRVCLAVHTDNISAILLVCEMQFHSTQLGPSATEIAPAVAAAAYAPDVVSQVPGKATYK